MVGLKLVVLTFVVGIGIFYIQTDNWVPFMPNHFTGVLKGVSAIFFAYIGFDAISTTAEECSNPQRDLPRGMIYSLIICTIVYVIVTLVITGMVNYSEFKNVADPLAYVFEKINLRKIGYIVSISAVVAATSVMIVFQIGQPRIWMSMSRDGLLPKRFSKIHPKFHTPSFATVVTGFVVALPALFVAPSCWWVPGCSICQKRKSPWATKNLACCISMDDGSFRFCCLFSFMDTKGELKRPSPTSATSRTRRFCSWCFSSRRSGSRP